MAAVNDRDVRLVAVDSFAAYRIVNEHLTLPRAVKRSSLLAAPTSLNDDVCA